MELKSIIMDEAAVIRSLTHITHEIPEKNRGAGDLCLRAPFVLPSGTAPY